MTYKPKKKKKKKGRWREVDLHIIHPDKYNYEMAF